MTETLSAIFSKFSALDPVHRAAVGVWIGSWALRTSLWPIAAYETWQRKKKDGEDLNVSSAFKAAAPSVRKYIIPWAVLKTTQWGSMAYLGTEIVRSFMPVKIS